MDHRQCTANGKRACIKIAVIIAVLLLLLCGIIGFADIETTLNQLKHTLSLWEVVALVVAINIVSFLCFIVVYGAYQWVRRDLRPRQPDDLDV